MGKNPNWKAHERRTAAALGAQRVGNTGRATADVVNDWLVVECKARKALPEWLKAAVRQAEAAAGEYQLPLVALHEVGGPAVDDLVVMRISEFRAWFGGWRGNGDPNA